MGVLSFISDLQANDARQKQLEIERQKMDLDAELRREAMRNAIQQITQQGEQTRQSEAARQEGVRKQLDITKVADQKELHNAALQVGIHRGMSPEQAKDFADMTLANAVSSGTLEESSKHLVGELYNQGVQQHAREAGVAATKSGIAGSQFSTAMSDLGTLRANAAKDFAGDRAATDEMAQIANNVAAISGAGVQTNRNFAALPLAGEETRTNMQGNIQEGKNRFSTALGRAGTSFNLGKVLDQTAIDKAEAERATAQNTQLAEQSKAPFVPLLSTTGALAQAGQNQAAGETAKFQGQTTSLLNPQLAATAENARYRMAPDMAMNELIRPLASVGPGTVLDDILRRNPAVRNAITSQLSTALGAGPSTNATPGLNGVLGTLKGLK